MFFCTNNTKSLASKKAVAYTNNFSFFASNHSEFFKQTDKASKHFINSRSQRRAQNVLEYFLQKLQQNRTAIPDRYCLSVKLDDDNGASVDSETVVMLETSLALLVDSVTLNAGADVTTWVVRRTSATSDRSACDADMVTSLSTLSSLILSFTAAVDAHHQSMTFKMVFSKRFYRQKKQKVYI